MLTGKFSIALLQHGGRAGFGGLLLLGLLGCASAPKPTSAGDAAKNRLDAALGAEQPTPASSPLASLARKAEPAFDPASEWSDWETVSSAPRPATSSASFANSRPPAKLFDAPDDQIPRRLVEPTTVDTAADYRLVEHTEAYSESSIEPLPAPVVSRPIEGRPPRFVSDTFVEADLRQAIQTLAAQAGVRAVIGDDIEGSANGTFVNTPFEVALRNLLMPVGAVYRVVGDEVLVGMPNPESPLFPLLTEQFDFRAEHRSPADLIELLPTRYRPYLRTGPRGSLIIVDAPPEIAQPILDSLHRADQPTAQVVLEALVCVYAPETNFRFGFDIEKGVSINGDAASIAISGLTMQGNLGGTGAASLNNFSHTSAVLRALEQKGYVAIKASPRIMAEDGQKAAIQIGRESYFSVQQGNTATLFTNNIQRVEAGIMLDITPSIHGDRVTVHIENAEVSEDIHTNTSAQTANNFPVINRRRVSTTVHVHDGETIVIGGLTQRQTVDNVAKVPVLGDIPYLGMLFQSIEKQEKTTEVAIFISPKIVRTSP